MAGWQPNTLLAAIRTRLLSDTGAGGLAETGDPLVSAVYARLARPAPADAFPYVVFYVNAVSGSGSFDGEQHRVGLVAEWYVNESSDGVDALDTAGAILERIVGDVTENNPPTYGLAFWAPTLQTGWSATPITFLSAQDESQDVGLIRWVANFELTVSKATDATGDSNGGQWDWTTENNSDHAMMVWD